MVEFECIAYGASSGGKLMCGMDGGTVFDRGFLYLVYFFALCHLSMSVHMWTCIIAFSSLYTLGSRIVVCIMQN